MNQNNTVATLFMNEWNFMIRNYLMQLVEDCFYSFAIMITEAASHWNNMGYEYASVECY